MTRPSEKQQIKIKGEISINKQCRRDRVWQNNAVKVDGLMNIQRGRERDRKREKDGLTVLHQIYHPPNNVQGVLDIMLKKVILGKLVVKLRLLMNVDQPLRPVNARATTTLRPCSPRLWSLPRTVDCIARSGGFLPILFTYRQPSLPASLPGS